MLGPLQVVSGGVALPLGPRKQQLVLATLAVHAGRVVGVDELVDELWPDRPPASAVSNVRTYAARLRRLLRSVDAGGVSLDRQAGGYLLDAANRRTTCRPSGDCPLWAPPRCAAATRARRRPR